MPERTPLTLTKFLKLTRHIVPSGSSTNSLFFGFPMVKLYMGDDDAFGFQFIPSGTWTINDEPVHLRYFPLPDALRRQKKGEFMYCEGLCRMMQQTQCDDRHSGSECVQIPPPAHEMCLWMPAALQVCDNQLMSWNCINGSDTRLYDSPPPPNVRRRERELSAVAGTCPCDATTIMYHKPRKSPI